MNTNEHGFGPEPKEKAQTKGTKMKNTLLALLGFILLADPLAATAQQSGDFTYTSDGSTITITGYMGGGGAVTIPATITGLPVTTIENYVFYNKTSLTSVTIPGTVTRLGRFAFGNCTSLTNVTIPGSVSSIEDSTFYQCTGLTGVTLLNGIASIGDEMFAGCINLASITLPGSVTNIGTGAFSSCSMTVLSVPGGVARIGPSAFDSCARLTNVTILNGVTSLGDSAFYQCTSLTSVTIPGSVTNIGDFLLADCHSLTSITILNGVTSIGNGMFIRCGSLTGITIPGSVTNIGWTAFYSSGLTSLTIPAGLTSIGDNAFVACFRLKSVFFKGNPPGFGSGVFDGFMAPSSATVYYLPGATGWGATFAGRPTRLWNPLMQTSGPGFGVGPTGFSFNINGTADIPIVVEACANLGNASWVGLQSLNLTNGAFYFSDPDWTNYPARLYRIRSL